ncbi:MAG: CARDB domain-containing protein [Dehalococcoidales bacterium]|jgi:subtilase family serine protease
MIKSLAKLALILALLTATGIPALSGCSPDEPAVPPSDSANATQTRTPVETTAMETGEPAAVIPGSSHQAEVLAAEIEPNPDVLEADLLVTAITWSPLDPAPGDAVTFSVTIANQGRIESGASRVNYLVDNTLMGDSLVDPIPAGCEVKRHFIWRVERLNYRVKVIADAADTVAESDETNNALEVTLSETHLADLTTDNITWSPQNPSPDDIVTFTVTIGNHGKVQSAPCQLDYYVDGILKGNKTISRIAAYDTATSTFTWKATSGSHTVEAVADGAGVITETDESNNSREISLTSIFHSDLTIGSITWSPQNASPGQEVTVTVTIKNQGQRPAERSITYCYLDGRLIDPIQTPAIAAGSTATATFTMTAASGTHYVSATADYYNSVPESNEGNNNTTTAISGITFADLTIDNIRWSPLNPSQGETVTITATVKNSGGHDADASLLYCCINGTKIGTSRVSAIPAGGSATASLTWPAELGTNTIRVVADHTSLVPETSETNNDREVIFSGTRPVDLIINDINWSPLNPFLNETMTITVTVKNQGSGQALASEVYFDIDGSHSETSSLPLIPPGGSANTTFTWQAGMGSHIFKAIADPANNIPESDDSNNERQASFSATVIPKPDLVIRNLVWSPLKPCAGQAVTFTVTLANQGTASAPPSWIRFTVDGVQVKTVRIFTIPAGETWNESFTWTASTGTHHIDFSADATQSILETDEANNVAAFDLTAIKPD